MTTPQNKPERYWAEHLMVRRDLLPYVYCTHEHEAINLAYMLNKLEAMEAAALAEKSAPCQAPAPASAVCGACGHRRHDGVCGAMIDAAMRWTCACTASAASAVKDAGETKVRVFVDGPYAKVWRGETDGDYLVNGRFEDQAGGSPSTTQMPELPPAKVPAWLEAHGYNLDGTRKPEKPATPIDPDAGEKYGAAAGRLVKLAKEIHGQAENWRNSSPGSTEERSAVGEMLRIADELMADAAEVERLDKAGARHGTYVLRVKGDSLKAESLLDGDYVIIERRDSAVLGQIAVYLLPDGTRSLRRSCDALPPGSKVEGVLIGSLRTYKEVGGGR